MPAAPASSPTVHCRDIAHQQPGHGHDRSMENRIVGLRQGKVDGFELRFHVSRPDRKPLPCDRPAAGHQPSDDATVEHDPDARIATRCFHAMSLRVERELNDDGIMPVAGPRANQCLSRERSAPVSGDRLVQVLSICRDAHPLRQASCRARALSLDWRSPDPRLSWELTGIGTVLVSCRMRDFPWRLIWRTVRSTCSR